MYCVSCGLELPINSNFCPACGSKGGTPTDNTVEQVTVSQGIVNNTFIWILALAPILTTIIELILSSGQGLGPASIVIAVVFNTLFAVLDEGAVKKAGFESSNLAWAIFLVPVYIWKRATITKQSRAYFWVWIGCFVLDIFIAIA